MSKLFDLTGKTALITGGTGVLGTAMAKGLADAGANTVILGRRKESGDELVKSIKSQGARSMFVKADVLTQRTCWLQSKRYLMSLVPLIFS